MGRGQNTVTEAATWQAFTDIFGVKRGTIKEPDTDTVLFQAKKTDCGVRQFISYKHDLLFIRNEEGRGKDKKVSEGYVAVASQLLLPALVRVPYGRMKSTTFSDTTLSICQMMRGGRGSTYYNISITPKGFIRTGDVPGGNAPNFILYHTQFSRLFSAIHEDTGGRKIVFNADLTECKMV